MWPERSRDKLVMLLCLFFLYSIKREVGMGWDAVGGAMGEGGGWTGRTCSGLLM